MSDTAVSKRADAVDIRQAARPRLAMWQRVSQQIRATPLGAFGLLLVLIVSIASIFANRFAAYGPTELAGMPLQHPSGAHWFGTDDLGRDIFSRILYGGRISLRVGFFSVLIGVTLGTLIGLVSAYRSGWFDLLVQRVIDAMMSFPTLVMALAIVAALGTSQRNVVIAIAVAMLPNASRVTRSAVFAIREDQYIEAARSVGASDRRIMLRHVLPNVIGPLIVVTTAYFGAAIVSEAALSFVGLGVPPPHPSWGNMMSGQARTYITIAWWMAFFPGLALSMLVFGINLVGDALRDTLDPRLRKR